MGKDLNQFLSTQLEMLKRKKENPEIEWQDVNDLRRSYYNEAEARDTTRRGYKLLGEYIDAGWKIEPCEAESGVSKDGLNEFDLKMLNFQQEKQRFQDQRREFNKLVISSGRAKHLEDRLCASAESLAQTIGRIDFKDGSYYSPSNSEAVLVLSDWHYGMTTSNIWNTYNTKICKERVSKVIESTLSCIHIHKCKHLHVVVLGDMVHGAIHTSARVASEELVCDQIMQVSETLAQSIEHLSQFVDGLSVYMTYGNHGRTVQDKKDSVHSDNMERIIPWWLTQRLGYCENVDVYSEFEHELIYFNVCGKGICSSHGDLDNVKRSPRILSTLFQKKFGHGIDYVLLGDKHHRETFEEFGVNSIICGSLCGSDEYANNKRLYSTPEQLLLIFSENEDIVGEYHLSCQ